MKLTEFDGDEILTDFLTDYIDGNLDETEKSAFEDYLDQNEREKEFTLKAIRGKKALSSMARKLKNTNFEATRGLSTT